MAIVQGIPCPTRPRVSLKAAFNTLVFPVPVAPMIMMRAPHSARFLLVSRYFCWTSASASSSDMAGNTISLVSGWRFFRQLKIADHGGYQCPTGGLYPMR